MFSWWPFLIPMALLVLWFVLPGMVRAVRRRRDGRVILRLDANDRAYLLAMGGSQEALRYLELRAGDGAPAPVPGYGMVWPWPTLPARSDAARKAGTVRRRRAVAR